MLTRCKMSMRILSGSFALFTVLLMPVAYAADHAPKAKGQHVKLAPQSAAINNGSGDFIDASSGQRAYAQFKLSPQEIQAVLAKHRTQINESRDQQLEEVVVNEPTELLPMRSEVNSAWGGLLAPVWAVLNPTQSWRIFFPVLSQ